MLFFGSCRLCEPSPSPALSIIFNGSKRFTKVHTLEPQRILYGNNAQNTFFLPLWVGSEKLSYVFYNDINSDTVSVTYSRKFQLNSTRCGYQYEISELKIAKPTSFKSLVFNPYSFQIVVNDY
jgi:hypothetical protein